MRKRVILIISRILLVALLAAFVVVLVTKEKDSAERHEDLNVVMTLVPNTCLILSDKLPVDAPVHDQNEDIDHVMACLGDALSFVDLREVLSFHGDEYIYYKTDHHWTSLAAGYAFDEIKDALGGNEKSTLQNARFEDYIKYTVAEDFSGTLASKCGYMKVKDTKDIVIIDPRYYCDDIEMVIRSEKITDVLILYNVNTFNGDRFIADVLEKMYEYNAIHK